MRRRFWFGGLAGTGLALVIVACGGGGGDSTFGGGQGDAQAPDDSSAPGTFGKNEGGKPDGSGSHDGAIDCEANPALCLTPGVCGDGKPGLGESCDDGNKADGDGCSSTCQIEGPYWACAFGQACVDVRNCAALADAGQDGGCIIPPKASVCGDSVVDPGEACDDGNVTGGDGCSLDCKTIEGNFVCPTPGKPCISTVVCGDGKITGTEQCDDGNAKGGDGCSAACQLESGWTCLLPNTTCAATKCGDGLLAGAEECDDGNNLDNDGCSAACRLQTTTVIVDPTPSTPPHSTVVNWQCVYPMPINMPPHQVCTQTVCGNGTREGTEQCDDGNGAAYDGCTPDCQFEPQCPNGACVARCGDGLLFDFDADGDGFPDEQCDDGNTRSGDGCSSTCKVESGYQCSTVTDSFPPYIDVPVVIRDFKYWNGGDLDSHPDYEVYGCGGITPDLVKPTLTSGVPVFQWDGTGNDPVTGMPGPCGQQLTSALDFTDWYKDIAVNVGGVNHNRSKKLTGVNIRLLRSGVAGAYSYGFDSANDNPYAAFGGWYPIDNLGWGNQGSGHNFAFSTEFRYWFSYDATTSPTLDFSGDDDVWVFINGKLALDLGGLHPRVSGSFVLDNAKATALGLVDKRLYEVALFNAERHTNQSNFKLTMGGFVRKHSVCGSVCGDSIKTPNEQCDLGAGNVDPMVTPVPYGGCSTSCTLGPYCGDKTAQNPPEACDDGVNLTPWTASSMSTACGPGCIKPAYCGDGTINGAYGERCDNAAANSDDPMLYGGCRTTCQPGPRCGDAVVQGNFGETCDNGFNITSYIAHPSATDCAPGCKKPRSCGDASVDFPFEQCDMGASNTNSGAYGSCTLSCTLGPHCGDGKLQAPEQCDDGNLTNGDGCSAACQKEGSGTK